MKKRISVVIPVYNEEGNVCVLYERLVRVIDSCGLYDWQICFVDDGSKDGTWTCVETIAVSDSRVSALRLSRNFGHQAALLAGLHWAEGDAVVMMDGDLQHPPELIPTMVAEWEKGNDIVSTVREEPEDFSLAKKISSWLYYKLWHSFSGIEMREGSADFRLLSAGVLTEFKRFKEKALFIRGLVQWVGFKNVYVRYQADRRFSGASKYSLLKMLQLALAGITSFSALPLRFASMFGSIVAFLGFLYAAYAIVMKVGYHVAVPGWTSILISVLFLGGVQLLTIGILGEYLAKVYDEAKDRPPYIVQNRLCPKERGRSAKGT